MLTLRWQKRREAGIQCDASPPWRMAKPRRYTSVTCLWPTRKSVGTCASGQADVIRPKT